MQSYVNSLDPNEVEDFAWDWSDELDEGETIAAIDDVTFVAAAGTSEPNPASFADSTTRVWLTGGNDGETAKWTVRVSTSSGRVLEEAFSVQVVDNSSVAAVETDVDRLTREIAEVKAQRHKVMTGGGVIDAWRDGRRIKKSIPSLAEFEAYVRVLKRELAEALAAESGQKRRRPILLQYPA